MGQVIHRRSPERHAAVLSLWGGGISNAVPCPGVYWRRPTQQLSLYFFGCECGCECGWAWRFRCNPPVTGEVCAGRLNSLVSTLSGAGAGAGSGDGAQGNQRGNPGQNRTAGLTWNMANFPGRPTKDSRRTDRSSFWPSCSRCAREERSSALLSTFRPPPPR